MSEIHFQITEITLTRWKVLPEMLPLKFIYRSRLGMSSKENKINRSPRPTFSPPDDLTVITVEAWSGAERQPKEVDFDSTSTL